MKKRELLDILGEIDEELVSDAAPDRNAKKSPKKRNIAWLKYSAVAAVCLMVLAGAMAAKPVLDLLNPPDADESDTAQSEDRDENNNGVLEYPEETGVPGVNEPVLEFEFGVITDPRYLSYAVSGYGCSMDMVGEKLGEISVDIYSNVDGKTYTVMAEVNEVVGMDGELYLCFRYIDNGENNSVNTYLASHNYFQNYSFMTAKSYSFATFGEMRESYWGGMIMSVSPYASYYKNTEETYCRNFKFTQDAEGLIRQYLSELDGTAIALDDVEGQLALIKNGCFESVNFNCSGFMEDLSGGQVIVYDNGYLYFHRLGGQLFEIGEENAQEIIDAIVKHANPQGYVWNEQEGKWYPVSDSGIALYEGFRETLEKNDLINKLQLIDKVNYWETYLGFAPSSFTLGDGLKEEICAILYSADGDSASVYNISAIAGESVTLTHRDSHGATTHLTVYDSGHVYFGSGSTFYDIGKENAEKIIDLVTGKGTPPSNFEWDEEYQEWHTICFEDDYRENPPESLKEAIELYGLYGKLNVIPGRIEYHSMTQKPHPPYFSIDEGILLQLYELIYSLEGSVVENPDEIAYDKWSIALDRLDENGMRERCMWIYADGYINFGDFLFDVGNEATEKIYDLIVITGQPYDGYKWNPGKGIWEKTGSDSVVTPPIIGGGDDIYEDDEIASETAIESERME